MVSSSVRCSLRPLPTVYSSCVDSTGEARAEHNHHGYGEPEEIRRATRTHSLSIRARHGLYGGHKKVRRRLSHGVHVLVPLSLARISPDGVDLVLDCMGGDDCERGLNLLKFNGNYVMYGTSSLLSWDAKNLFGFTKGMTNVGIEDRYAIRCTFAFCTTF